MDTIANLNEPAFQERHDHPRHVNELLASVVFEITRKHARHVDHRIRHAVEAEPQVAQA